MKFFSELNWIPKQGHDFFIAMQKAKNEISVVFFFFFFFVAMQKCRGRNDFLCKCTWSWQHEIQCVYSPALRWSTVLLLQSEKNSILDPVIFPKLIEQYLNHHLFQPNFQKIREILQRHGAQGLVKSQKVFIFSIFFQFVKFVAFPSNS